MGKLVILRGPSGSGKTSTAKLLFKQMKEPAVHIQQDPYRFIFKPEGYGKNSETIHQMIKSNVLIALENGYDVIVDGIFTVKSYKDTFDELFAEHKTENYMFTFDISFEETVRRHAFKNTDAWGEKEMREWYVPKDFMGYDFETIIPESSVQEETIAQIKKIAGI